MNQAVIIIAVMVVLALGGLVYFIIEYKNTSYLDVENQDNSLSPTSKNGQSYDVNIADFAFMPITLNINRGDKVTWTSGDSAPHTVKSDSGSELSSSTLTKGQTYSKTFNTAGTYSYHCSFHSMMKGKIIVQ